MIAKTTKDVEEVVEKVAAKKTVTKNRSTRSKKAGLVLPVGRVHRYLKKGRFAARISQMSSVYLAGVLEYLIAELLELAGNASKANKRKTVTPRHVMIGIRNDAELNELCKNVHIANGGVLVAIHPALLKKADRTIKAEHKGPIESQEF